VPGDGYGDGRHNCFLHRRLGLPQLSQLKSYKSGGRGTCLCANGGKAQGGQDGDPRDVRATALPT
jgi:hypothetical protein